MADESHSIHSDRALSEHSSSTSESLSRTTSQNTDTVGPLSTENKEERTGHDVEKGLAALETTPTNHSNVNNNNGTGLDHIRSHVSQQEMHASNHAYREENAEQYLRFSPKRKVLIVFILAFCSFLAPVSSTSILAAVPEVAQTFNTTGSMINASNAVFMLFMGLSSTFWGTFSQILGRRPMSFWSSFLFFVFSVATALSPNLAAYFIFRALTAFQGTSFLVVSSASISDIYTPTERATALAWFLSGTLVGPALGPFLGGVIVTYRSWRVIFWVQSALAGAAFVLVAFFIPETIPHKAISDLSDLTPLQKTRAIWIRTQPAI